MGKSLYKGISFNYNQEVFFFKKKYSNYSVVFKSLYLGVSNSLKIDILTKKVLKWLFFNTIEVIKAQEIGVLDHWIVTKIIE